MAVFNNSKEDPLSVEQSYPISYPSIFCVLGGRGIRLHTLIYFPGLLLVVKDQLIHQHMTHETFKTEEKTPKVFVKENIFVFNINLCVYESSFEKASLYSPKCP